MERAVHESGDADDFGQSIFLARSGSVVEQGNVLAACRDYLLAVAHRELDPGLRAKVGPSDVVQETFAQARDHFAGFRGATEEELRGWLRRLLLNNIVTARRRFRAAEARDVGREISLNDSDFSGAAAAHLVAAGPSPSQVALLDEQAQVVSDVLDLLPSDYQQVLRLRYWENLPLTEIADKMQRSPDAVQKLWFRAIQQFKREFAADGGD